MTKRLIEDLRYLEDEMDVDSLASAITNLQHLAGEIRNLGGDPATTDIHFPWGEKAYIVFKRLEDEDEYQSRVKLESKIERDERDQLARLKAKYEGVS